MLLLWVVADCGGFALILSGCCDCVARFAGCCGWLVCWFDVGVAMFGFGCGAHWLHFRMCLC